MNLSQLTDFWFNTDKWITSYGEENRTPLVPVFIVTSLLIPLASMIADAVAQGQSGPLFLRILSAQLWSQVSYFIISNLLVTSILFFIGTLIHEKESRHHTAKFFLTSMILSATPLVLLPAIALLAKHSGIGEGFFLTGKLLLLLWSLVIQITLIRHIFGFTSVKSFLLFAGAVATVFLFDILLLFNSLATLFFRLS